MMSGAMHSCAVRNEEGKSVQNLGGFTYSLQPPVYSLRYEEVGELAELGMPGEGESQEEKSGLGEFPVREMWWGGWDRIGATKKPWDDPLQGCLRALHSSTDAGTDQFARDRHVHGTSPPRVGIHSQEQQERNSSVSGKSSPQFGRDS